MPPGFLNSSLLQEPAPRVVRLIAQVRLQRTLEEAARVELRTSGVPVALPTAEPSSDATDPEAIHDFRVALRRLRAWLRAFRPYLADTVRRGPQRRLRALSRLAGRARDLEVQYRWLPQPGPGRSAPTAESAQWLAGQIGRDLARARRVLTEGLRAELPEASTRLAGELQHYYADIAVEGPAFEPMAAAMAQALRQATAELTVDLQRVRRAGQVEAAHSARIAIKRLRYLLEAFGQESQRAARILPRLIALQHRFGELHDAQVLRQHLREVSARKRGKGGPRKAGGRPAPRALAALRNLLTRRIAAAFRQVYQAGRSEATKIMFARVEALTRSLDQRG